MLFKGRLGEERLRAVFELPMFPGKEIRRHDDIVFLKVPEKHRFSVRPEESGICADNASQVVARLIGNEGTTVALSLKRSSEGGDLLGTGVKKSRIS